MPAPSTREILWDQPLSALALLTRLPLPRHQPQGAASAWAWPLVGALIGGIAALVMLAATEAKIHALLVPLLALVTMVILTGGLHEDGLADSADGLWGGRDPARRLEIMKDSRIGSFGVLALIFCILAQFLALTEYGTIHPIHAVITSAILSRAPMAMVMALLPPARANGISVAMGRPGLATALAATVIALALGWSFVGASVIAAAIGVALVSLVVALVAKSKIGGQTGDILGATQQLSFTISLILLAGH